ncbi:DUF1178 family protein [Acetobacter oeni]|uniref:DUF1178 domain-containing protein n=1 Tax=Acetobacter oeni TaxID=304077 RepID=A0A511XKG3_9PROT|nr:DUF1178 family protein [Acetobacter oeni]MBB3881376.1 hypothetical protein [Acetobacter oeni]NHO18244.1 DUF1178 family protein [Acetobacter oeni]GBR11189.1 hypothetical protein AA21952_3291 [Acetobacter oeni LMG 21952]GEN63431.1 hypothetical protein AOE01nite_16550 [Acetobacter oeni]
MILYRLRCVGAHEFEGWFRDSGAFEDQARRNLLTCPFCGTAGVDRALMAPAVRTARVAEDRATEERATEEKAPEPETAVTPVPVAAPADGAPVPDVLMAALRRLRHNVETTCENVGDRFADEALRIHRGEGDERGIYGSMSGEQKELLEDEGVAVQALPWVSRADS